MATPDPNAAGGAPSQASSDAVRQRVGSTIGGRYRVISLLGEGGMGAVFLVEHTQIRKRMALKVLNLDLMQNPEMVTRFEREALAAAHLEHPNVVAATDLGRTEDGALFLVLEYVDGSNLRDVLGFGAMPAARVLHIARQLVSALVRAHSLSCVHRDLKPENIMLAQRDGDLDFVKVLDFGLAKVRVEALLATEGDATRSEALTRYGTIFGTPAYMAPEQAVGAEVDGRTDLYSLGVIMYELLTGEPPFLGEDPAELLKAHVISKVPPMIERVPGLRIPPVLEQLVMKLLEKRPDKRPQEARLVLETIDQIAIAEGLRFEPSQSLNRMVMPTSGPVRVGGAQLKSASDEATIMRPTDPAALEQSRSDSADPSSPSSRSSSGPGGSGGSGKNVDNSFAQAVTARAVEGTPSTGVGLAFDLTPEASPQVGPGSDPKLGGGTDPNHKLRAPSVVDLSILKPDTANPAFLAPAPPPTFAERVWQLTKEAAHFTRTVIWPTLKRGAARAWRFTRTHVPVWWNGLLNFIRPRLPLKLRGLSQLVLGLVVGAILLVPLIITILVWPSGDSGPRKVSTITALPGFASDAEMEQGVDKGVPALTKLVAKYPSDARGHRALVRAYATQKNYSEALKALAPLLQLDPSIQADEVIGQIVAEAALVPETSDAAIALLESGLGEHGVDVLLELADKTTMEPWRNKLNQSLLKPAVQKLASPEALLVLELRGEPRCEAKKAIVKRAGQHGGTRVQGFLQQLQLTNGCGPGAKLDDCWPCMRKDKVLQNAIKAIDQRGGQPG